MWLRRPTIVDVTNYFICSSPDGDEILAVWDAGKRHGEMGWYPYGDFSSDADWCCGIGAKIQKLEEKLGIDDGAIFDVYQSAHGAHLPQEEGE